MEKERVNLVDSFYTVKRYTYGVAVFGSMRCPEFLALSNAWADEFTIIDAKIGFALGASFVFTTKENSERWREELEIG